MKLNTKQIKKVDGHLKNVMDFLMSWFEDDDDENLESIKKDLQIVIDILNKK